MKRLVMLLVLLALAAGATAQDPNNNWGKNYMGNKWLVKAAGQTVNTWDSVKTTAVWSEYFPSWDYQSVYLHMIKDSVRVYVEYWAGPDTNRATMVYGRTLTWDKAADLDSTYVASTGYWNANITEEAIPVHNYGRLKVTPGASGSRKIGDDSLFVIYITGRK